MVEKLTKNLIPIAIIIAGVCIAGAVIYINQGEVEKLPSENLLSPQEAAEKVLEYIDQNVLKGQATASLVNVIEDSGLYKLRIKIGEEELDLYVSKNGNLLFTQVIDLAPPPAKDIPKADIPDVKLFVMSFCPYGNQAEELMMPVVNLLGNKADIKLQYIVSKNADAKFTSLHGEQELHQDIREICVHKYQKEKFWDFVMEINKNCTFQDVDTKWEKIASDLGIDVQKIKDCQEKEGTELLSREFELIKKEYEVQNPSAHNGREYDTISGSPTLVINDMIYDGERSSEEYKNGICSGSKNPPGECSETLASPTNSSGGSCE